MIWEFHIINPDQAYFQVLPGLPLTLLTSCKMKEEEEEAEDEKEEEKEE